MTEIATPTRAQCSAALATHGADHQLWQAIQTLGDAGMLGWDRPTLSPAPSPEPQPKPEPTTVMLTICTPATRGDIDWVRAAALDVLTQLVDVHHMSRLAINAAHGLTPLTVELARSTPAGVQTIVVTHPGAGERLSPGVRRHLTDLTLVPVESVAAADMDAHVIVWDHNAHPDVAALVSAARRSPTPIIRIDVPTREVITVGRWPETAAA